MTEDNRNNLKNDALLHKLVHTQILSGSLKSDLRLAPAERRKALEGRVRELAGGVKLGQGESSVRREERNKASKRVRMGLERKVDERREKSLEDVRLQPSSPFTSSFTLLSGKEPRQLPPYDQALI